MFGETVSFLIPPGAVAKSRLSLSASKPPPHAQKKQASRIVAVAVCRNKDHNQQTVSVLVSAPSTTCRGEQKEKSGPLISCCQLQTTADE